MQLILEQKIPCDYFLEDFFFAVLLLSLVVRV